MTEDKKPTQTDSGKEEIKTPLKKIKTEKVEASKPASTDSGRKEDKKPAKRVIPADFAIIRTGGKQHIVRVGERLRIEKIDVEEGKTVKFDDVLLTTKGGKVEIGTPKLKTIVEAKVLSQTKADKIVVFKYKKRKNYRRKQGHRQRLTEIEIAKI